MLSLVLRRAVVQARLLVGVVALVTFGATLLGVGTLLLTTTQDRAFALGMQQSTPEQVDVTAFLVGLAGSDEARLRADARAVVGDALRPLGPRLSSTAVSRMRRLDGDAGLAYLSSTDSLISRATLTDGRLPAGPGEAVVPTSAVGALHLHVGDRLTLGAEVGDHPARNSATVVVVGLFRPTSRAGWENDPLTGDGRDASFTNGSLPTPTPAYGPFVVDEQTFRASGSTVDALQVTGHPSMRGTSDDSVGAVAAALRSADGLLSARVGDRAEITRVASDLPQTLDRVRAQQAATRSTVLAVLLLGTTLAITALLLAGRLLAGARSAERELLAGLGAGRRQLARTALIETLLIVAGATAVAIPSAALVHAALSRLPSVQAAGLAQGPGVTATLVLVEAGAAFALTLALAVPALGSARAQGRVAVSLRSGIDAVLVALAVGAWWQLHSLPDTASSGDVVRTLAPVVCVLAATGVAVRRAPLVLTLVARAADRSTAVVLPLATTQAARRPYAGAALVLLAMCAASATFGLSVASTWERSQADQAALRVGTDLALDLAAPATARQARQVDAVTRGSATSAVVDRPLALGRFVGDPGEAPMLVAVDSRRAGTLLRGRLDGDRTWSQVGHLLAPGPAVEGLPIGSDQLRVRGTATRGASIEAIPTLVVQDRSGYRSTAIGEAVPLDGRAHRLRGVSGLAGSHLVAARFSFASSGPASSGSGPTVTASMVLFVPGAAPASGAAQDLRARAIDVGDSPIEGAEVTARTTSRGTVVRSAVQIDLGFLSFVPGDVLLTAFDAPDVVPVAVSRQLADAVHVRVGGELKATVAGTEVPLRVAAVVPAIPSAPGSIAVLADADTLSRVLINAGRVEPVVDAWWVANSKATTARALSGLGKVTTRDGAAADLRHGPLRVSTPASLRLLVIAAGLLLLAGTALLVAADGPARSMETARLRALGVSRKQAVRLGIIEHGILLSLLVPMGDVVGAAAAFAVGPELIRSDVGAAPVPAAVVVLPWASGAAVVVTMLVGCLAIAAALTIVAVRRSGPAQLRAADS